MKTQKCHKPAALSVLAVTIRMRRVMRFKLRKNSRFKFALSRARFKRAAKRRGSLRKLQGVWRITGHEKLENAFLHFGQVGNYVTGQLTLRRARSYSITGRNNNHEVVLNFQTAGKLEFIFKGKFTEANKVMGEFSGRLSGKATLSRFSHIKDFLESLT